MLQTQDEVRVVVVDDYEPTTLQAVERGIAARFPDQTVKVTAVKVRGTTSDWSEEGRTVLRAFDDAVPDVVLSDCYLLNSATDGARLLCRLCCDHGFGGFVYLWSSSDPAAACDQYPWLLHALGGGGFQQSQTDELAQRVRAHYEECGNSFRHPDPAARCFDVLEETLSVLTGLLPACWGQGSGEDLEAAKRRIGIDSTLPDFGDSILQKCARVHPSLGQERSAVRAAASAVGSSADLVAEVTTLRDALLALCAACGRI